MENAPNAQARPSAAVTSVATSSTEHRVDGRGRWLALGSLLLIALVLRFPGLSERSIWYDEAITLMVTSGQSRPDWPDEPVSVGTLAPLLESNASPGAIVDQTRRFDAHPPLGYLAFAGWKRLFGPSIEAARGLSLLASLFAVVCLYSILRRLRTPGAWALTLVYAVSTGAVHSGHEARAYALANAVLLGAVWMGVRAVAEGSTSGSRWGVGFAVGTGLLTALAFHLNYVTLFSTGALLAWVSWRLWRLSARRVAPRRVVAMLVVSLAGGLLALPTILTQRQSGMSNVEGFAGWGASLRALGQMNLEILGLPTPEPGWRVALAWMVALSGVVGSFVVWRQEDRSSGVQLSPGVRLLWVMLAAAPSLGVLALDVLLDRQFHLPRYLVFAGPALAVLVGYGLVRSAEDAPTRSGRHLARGLLALLVALLVSNTNWAGLELCPNHQFGSTTRSLAQRIVSDSSPEVVVLLGEGAGHGAPAEVVYELLHLDPTIQVATFRRPEEVAPLLERVAGAPDLWVLFAVDGRSLEAENELLGRLQASGRYVGIHREARGLHVARAEGPG